MFKSKPRTQFIAGIDLGSSTIRAAVGQVDYDRGQADFNLLGVVEAASEGVRRGVVVSIEDTVSVISSCLEQLEHLIGLPIESCWVGVNSGQIICQENKGVVSVAKADGEITEDDIERVVESARTLTPPLNYEMMHTITRSYAVDNQTGIKDPVGMTGIRLEVDAQIIHGPVSHLNNISKAVYRTGVDIDDMVLSILPAANVVTTARQRDLGVAVVNIGSSITSLAVYENGDLFRVATLPIGSEHITNDLAIGLRTSIDIAEQVKIHYGQCVADPISRKEKIDLGNIGAESSEEVSRHYIAEIVEARVSEILEKINAELMAVGRAGMLPAGVIFTGGGSKIFGLIDLAKSVLKLPASLGYPVDMVSSTEKINDLSFATAIGLVKWGAAMKPIDRKKKNKQFTVINSSLKKAAGWLKTLVP